MERARGRLPFCAMRLARFLGAQMPGKAPKRPAKGQKPAKATATPKDSTQPTTAAKTPKKPRSKKPAAPLGADNPPAGLKATGLRVWRDFHGELPEGWSFDARELQALEAACRLYDRLDELDAAIDTHGATVPGSTGQLTVNPALPEFRQCAAAIVKLLGELEIPAAETGVPETAATKRGRKAAMVRWSGADHWSREALEHRRRRRGQA
jgi:phage terminase small subunit